MICFTCIGEKEELLEVYEKLSADHHFHCTLQQEIYRDEYWCEVMPAKATKAEAIKTLKKMCDCEKPVIFDDAINDQPMLNDQLKLMQ